jgi:hypothetical protein
MAADRAAVVSFRKWVLSKAALRMLESDWLDSPLQTIKEISVD